MKITRVTQQIFASNSATNQLAVFGSLAAGSPVLLGPGSPALIMGDSEYLSGWFAAIVDGAAPAIEDMNALQYLNSYQLAYLLQQGLPEWDAGTTYYTNGFAASSGKIYVSLQDNNLNNAVSSGSFWKVVSGLSSLNSLVGAVSLTSGSGITVTPSGSTISIAFTGNAANTTLSNLGSATAINQNLFFSADNVDSIGSSGGGAGNRPAGIYAGTVSQAPVFDMLFVGQSRSGSLGGWGFYKPNEIFSIGDFSSTNHVYMMGASDCNFLWNTDGVGSIGSPASSRPASIYSHAFVGPLFTVTAAGGGSTGISMTSSGSAFNLSFPAAQGVANSVLVNNGGGALTWKTLGGLGNVGAVGLVGGSATVMLAGVTSGSIVFLTVQALGTVTTAKAVHAVAGTGSFVITSADATDTSTVAYIVY